MAAESPSLEHLPWKTTPIYLGGMGVVLNKPIDNLTAEELSRGTNIIPRFGGGFDVRAGQASLITGGASVNSSYRLNDPAGATFTRFWGVDANLARGATGAFTNLEGGFSGNPLTFAAWQSELTGTPWVYVADSLKMRKATRTSASQQIGIAKPPQPIVTPNALDKRAVAAFNASDGTNAANWTTWNGRAVPPATGNPSPTLVFDAPGIVGNGVAMAPQGAGVTGGGYFGAIFLDKVMDLSTLASGTPVNDNDIFHIRFLLDRPDLTTEIRLYFVVGAAFANESALPGDHTSIINTSAYMRAFIPSDYTQAISGNATAAGAAATIQQNRFLDGFQDPSVTNASTAAAAGFIGANIWLEYGIIDLPVRRGDFVAIGAAGDAGFTWANVTGMVVATFVSDAENVNVTLNDSYFVGGGNPDTSEPDAQAYDYRVTNCSLSSGAESNPSDTMATTVEALRQKIVVQPVAAGNPDYFQRAYRRGGTNTNNWYFIGQNAADGAAITDNTADTAALVAGPVNIDHDQPVTTTDVNGNAVLAQPVPILFGPIEGFLFALGDPNRPGDYYWCKQNEPDHWPAANHETACPPSEQLMTGGKLASGQGFLLSRQRLYSLTVTADGPISSPTDCAKGTAGRWAACVGPNGIYFVARSDGVYVTSGSTPMPVSDQIRPLFRGTAVNGYNPVDWTVENALRLVVVGDDLWFGFQDTQGARVWWVYSILYKWWRFVSWGSSVQYIAWESHDNAALANTILCGTASGKAYTNTGPNDDGAAISWNARTGALQAGLGREEKLLGDLSVWGNLQAQVLVVTTYRDLERIVDSPNVALTSAVYDQFIFDCFGTQPAMAQTLSIDLQGTSAVSPGPFVSKVGVAISPLPEVTMNRVTTWEPAGNGKGEVYLTGCYIDSDTGGTNRTILVEVLLGGVLSTAATLTVNSSAGRRQWFSWQAVKADMVRLRPSDDCTPWILYGQDWLFNQEPARIAVWDTDFQNLGDSYLTGLDIECDTFGFNKTLHVSVDGVEIPSSPFVINSTGRTFTHLTFTPIRGHIVRAFCLASDTQVGLWYWHKWIADAEPGEQTNWNQNYTIAGSQADKWLKGFIVECDTFNAVKSVNVEVDGVAIGSGPFTVQANGRKVVQVSFPQQLGRVFRLLPADANKSRLYSLSWIFDEEPYQLTRFETQEQPNGIDDWQIPTRGQIALKSTAVVNMEVITYGQSGLILSDQTYQLPSTGNVKQLVSLHTFLTAQKGVWIKFIFTSASGFWLYREESWLKLQPWGGGGEQLQRPFGNDDLGPDRVMRNATLAAAKSGGAPVG